MKRYLPLLLFIGLVWGQILDDYKYVLVTVSLPIHYINDSQNNYGIDKKIAGVLKNKGLGVLNPVDKSKWPNEVKMNPCLVANILVTEKKAPNSWNCGKLKITVRDCNENFITDKIIKSKNAVCTYPYDCCYIRWGDAAQKYFSKIDYKYSSKIQISLDDIDFEKTLETELSYNSEPENKVKLINPSFIAVVDFTGNNVSDGDCSALTDRLRTELFNTNYFTLVEREMMDEIITEQGFQQSGCTTNECMVQVGKLIGVEQIVGGSISKVGSTYSVSARMVSIETGDILKIATYDFRGEIDDLLISGMKEVALQFIR